MKNLFNLKILKIAKEKFHKGLTNEENNTLSSNVNDKSPKSIKIDEYRKIYSKTIFLHSQNKRNIRDNTEYQQYIKYELEITNPKLFHQQMIKEGYFEQADFQTILLNYKNPQLKELLAKLNHKTSGKKEELIQRILDNVDDSTKNKILSESNFYVLSQKGNEFVKKNYDLVDLHNHLTWDIDLNLYFKTKNEIPFKCHFNDVAWSIFNQRTLEYQRKKEYNLLRNNYFHMYQLLYEEKKFEDALLHLLKVLVIDLNCVDRYSSIQFYKDGFYTKKELLEEFEQSIFAPGILSLIVNLENFYNVTIASLAYSQVTLPHNCCSYELFLQIINDLYHDSIFDKDKYSKLINKNFETILKTL